MPAIDQPERSSDDDIIVVGQFFFFMAGVMPMVRSMKRICTTACSARNPKAPVALKVIDDHRLRRVIGGGVALSGERNGAVAGVVVRPVFLVQAVLVGGAAGIANLPINQRQIVMSSHVL